MDRLLHSAVALQLDAAILSARRRAGAQLDRDRPPDFQPELFRGGFRSGGRPHHLRGQGDATRRLVVVRRGDHQPIDQTPHPEGDDCESILLRTRPSDWLERIQFLRKQYALQFSSVSALYDRTAFSASPENAPAGIAASTRAWSLLGVRIGPI